VWRAQHVRVDSAGLVDVGDISPSSGQESRIF
jgi:hypothetical protein